MALQNAVAMLSAVEAPISAVYSMMPQSMAILALRGDSLLICCLEERVRWQGEAIQVLPACGHLGAGEVWL